LQECDDEFGGDVLYPERSDLDPIIFCCKGEEDFEGVAVGTDRVKSRYSAGRFHKRSGYGSNDGCDMLTLDVVRRCMVRLTLRVFAKAIQSGKKIFWL